MTRPDMTSAFRVAAMQARRLGLSRPLFLALLALVGTLAQARQGEPPWSLAQSAKAGVDLPIEDVRGIDAARLRAQADAAARSAIGPRAKRLAVAVGTDVSFAPERNGSWQTLSDGSHLWHLRVRSSGATDLRLGFDRYALPPGATLYVIGADGYYQGPYDNSDAIDARFDAPVVPGDTATLELQLPADATLAPDALELGHIGAGFRDVFGREKIGSVGLSGACNINVACPLGQTYPDEVRAVGHYEFQAAGSRDYYICSGTLLADVPRSGRDWFVTAAHCISAASEAASIIVYWNYQSTQCSRLAAPPGGYFNDDQHGAVLRATRADVDVTLLELGGSADPGWNRYRAGWDASGALPAGTIGIHHPSGDVKKITAGPQPFTTGNCILDAPPRSDTHWMAGPYTQGTTEGGSSGSGLFAATGSGQPRRLIGTLSGGDAECSSASPTLPNAGTDCYGKFSVAWQGAAASMRLRDWLDPANSGTTSLVGGDGDPPSNPPLQHSTRMLPPGWQLQPIRAKAPLLP